MDLTNKNSLIKEDPKMMRLISYFDGERRERVFVPYVWLISGNTLLSKDNKALGSR